MDNLVAISAYFGVTLDYLLKGDEPGWEASDIPFEDTSQVVCAPYRTHYEYKSSTTLFGLPLVHINVGRFGLYRARGIIAVGNVATGLVSIGLISAGLLSFGCLSLGLLAMGAAALGLAALGGIALGAGIAAGGLAVGWPSAVWPRAFMPQGAWPLLRRWPQEAQHLATSPSGTRLRVR